MEETAKSAATADKKTAPSPNGTTPKKKPTKALPTSRINFKKQLELLRVYAIASGSNRKIVGNKAVAEIIKMDDGTTTMANGFFVDVGFLQRGEGGFLPSDEVCSFALAHEWNPEKASYKLAPLVAASWFGQALMPKLEYRPLEEKEAINNLADIANATPDYLPQLRLLIDYMEAAGLVQRDGSLLRAIKGSAQLSAAERPSINSTEPQGSRTAVSTVFSQPTDGVVQFNISVKVDMKEFAAWAPDRITAFFGGIAQVLAAKGKMEKDTI